METISNKSVFFEKYNVTTRDLETYLGEALSRGGDYADLFFEYRAGGGMSYDEGILKAASRGVSMGLGVRAQQGDATGYAYTEKLASALMMCGS